MKFHFEDEQEDINLLNDDELDTIEDDVEQVNEVRYIDPDNLNNYNKDEIEAVKDAQGNTRYKRKDVDSTSNNTKVTTKSSNTVNNDDIKQKVASTFKNPKVSATIDSLKNDWKNIYNNFSYDRGSEIQDAQTYFKLKELEQNGVDVEKEFAGVIDSMSGYKNKIDEINKEYNTIEKEAKEKGLSIGTKEYEPYRQKLVKLHNDMSQVRKDYNDKLGDNSDTVFKLYRVLSNYLDEKYKKPNAKEIRSMYAKTKNDYNKKLTTDLKKVEDRLKAAQAKNTSKDKQQKLYDLYNKIKNASKI